MLVEKVRNKQMINNLLLIGSLLFIFGGALFAYNFFGKAGLYAVTVIATITANIEALIMIRAFGMEQTLGNVFFAVTFLVTDILSETEGKKEANTENDDFFISCICNFSAD